MGNFIQNTIDFNVSQYTPTKLTKRASTAVYDLLIKDKYSYVVNAVEIDWNSAQLKNGSTVKATLNTTGEMLSILQTA